MPGDFLVSGGLFPLNRDDYVPGQTIRVGGCEVAACGGADGHLDGQRRAMLAFPVSEFEEARVTLSKDAIGQLGGCLAECLDWIGGAAPPEGAVLAEPGESMDLETGEDG